MVLKTRPVKRTEREILNAAAIEMRAINASLADALLAMAQQAPIKVADEIYVHVGEGTEAHHVRSGHWTGQPPTARGYTRCGRFWAIPSDYFCVGPTTCWLCIYPGANLWGPRLPGR